MSSLSQQLKSINEKTASIALDRSSRSKIHSRSLIFSPKVAATQDYDFLYQLGLEGLDELCDLDSRFNKFKQTLFSETSVSLDRNVQDNDTIIQLNKNINAFLTLISSYYLLNPSIKALEWLVRRFYINIHNAEVLLLTSLPFHSHQIFVKILNVIPKQQFPLIFQWLNGYKDLLKPPPSSSIIKAFHNDFDLFKFYSMSIMESLSNGSIFKQQLVFYLSITVQLLASLSKNLSVLNEKHLPVVLEVVGKMLLPKYESKYSNSIHIDIKLTSYAIIAVLGSVVPLSSELIVSTTSSILSDPKSVDSVIFKQTLIVLGQLWNYYNDSFEKLDCFDRLSVKQILTNNLISELVEQDYKINKFMMYFFLSSFPDQNSFELFKLIKVSGSKEFINGTIKAILNNSNSNVSQLVSIVELLLADNKQLFTDALLSQGSNIDELEMKLMTTFSTKENEDIEFEVSDGEEIEVDDSEVVSKVDLSSLKSTTMSFFDSKSDTEFIELSQKLISLLRFANVKVQKSLMFKFSSIFSRKESGISFFIRVGFTPAIPLIIRLSSLRFIKHRIGEIANSQELVDVYLLLPLFLLGLSDSNKSVRAGCAEIIRKMNQVTIKNHQGKKKVKTVLFMEDQVYNSTPGNERAIIPPQDSLFLFEVLLKDNQLEDTILDSSRINHILFEIVFKSSKSGLKKIGQLLLKTFVLNQWSLHFLPIVFKWKAWNIVASQNIVGSDDRVFFFESDIAGYLQKRADWITQAENSKIEFLDDVEKAIVGLVGGETSNEKILTKEVDWFIQSLNSDSPNLQTVINDRIIKVFPFIKPMELKNKLINKYLELLINDEPIEIDPIETLQTMDIDYDLFISILSNVQISSQMPEQGVAKRRRRSSNSTRIALARDDINNMASVHLRKLSIILDILENSLRNKKAEISKSELLQALFKILTDLDYLGNDGNLPVFYAQETLASCMLLCITRMKDSSKSIKLDSNSIRADLIVNSLRSSQSPQVQNRLLLVIAELASFAPEIVLHSVMPIFTFMGAHTIKQDDEFSNSALQQTIAKVIPALATNGSSSLANEIEFLLTSFVAAFQHIPRHRRVNLFISLSKTLGYETSLHVILFLMGQQYVLNYNKNKMGECNTIVEFTTTILKSFSAEEQLNGIAGFTDLWSQVPITQLDPNSEEYKVLSARSIFGGSILSLTDEGLSTNKSLLLKFIRSILLMESFNNHASLKLKIAVILSDDLIDENEKQSVLQGFKKTTSFILSCLDTFTNANENDEITVNLYELLAVFLDLLPLSYFVDSIVDSLQPQKLTDDLSKKIAKNYTTLAGRKVESELNASTIDDEVVEVIIGKFLPVLINGFEATDDVELEQSYLDTFSTIVNKFGFSSKELYNAANSKTLVESLAVLTKKLLSEQPEIIISSINAISSVVNVLGVKTIGFFPKIIPPAFKIYESTLTTDDTETARLIQTSIIVLLSCFIKKIPAFMSTNLDSTFLCILGSDFVENNIRSGVLSLIVDHVEASLVLKSLCNIWYDKKLYECDNAGDLGLYLKTMQLAVDKIDKKSASHQATVFIKWLIQVFEFRSYVEGGDKFDNNTIYRLESSFHQSAIAFVMKLNDKNFRPLFANLVRWAVDGEGSYFESSTEETRLTAFFRFFNKLQDLLKGIITSYFSYLLDPVSKLLQEFVSGKKVNIQLRRILLNSLTSSFKYDQDDYWSQQGRFETMCDPLLQQITNIETNISKYLIKAITAFISNVSSDEYNETLVHGLIKFISNENSTTDSNTKICTIKIIKNVFQKMGDQWLSYLPTLIPYIAELLEDDDEAVELEVRQGLVKVIENVLGEPLDRYLD